MQIKKVSGFSLLVLTVISSTSLFASDRPGFGAWLMCPYTWMLGSATLYYYGSKCDLVHIVKEARRCIAGAKLDCSQIDSSQGHGSSEVYQDKIDRADRLLAQGLANVEWTDRVHVSWKDSQRTGAREGWIRARFDVSKASGPKSVIANLGKTPYYMSRDAKNSICNAGAGVALGLQWASARLGSAGNQLQNVSRR